MNLADRERTPDPRTLAAIEKEVLDDVRPVRRVRAGRLAVVFGSLALLLCVCMGALLGGGSLLSGHSLYVAGAGFIVATASFYVALRSVIPAASAPWGLSVVIGASAPLLLCLSSEIRALCAPLDAAGRAASPLMCVGGTMLCALPLAVAAFVFVRRFLAFSPVRAGLLAGLASGMVGALTMNMLCGCRVVSEILVAHGFGVVMVTLLAAAVFRGLSHNRPTRP